ncbi:MAG: hypothetical protein M1457_09275 [bacterium]|nr:hypothetical protein [bacterium]
MDRCEVCGNEYDKCIKIVKNGETHTFDCFECAIQTMAPLCGHCGTHIIGHGVESDGAIYCCAHCASKEGIAAIRDRA